MTLAVFTNSTAGDAVMVGVGYAVATTPGPPRGFPSAIPTDELLYWSRVWLEGDAESTAARAAGDVCEFTSGREAVRWLLSDD